MATDFGSSVVLPDVAGRQPGCRREGGTGRSGPHIHRQRHSRVWRPLSVTAKLWGLACRTTRLLTNREPENPLPVGRRTIRQVLLWLQRGSVPGASTLPRRTIWPMVWSLSWRPTTAGSTARGRHRFQHRAVVCTEHPNNVPHRRVIKMTPLSTHCVDVGATGTDSEGRVVLASPCRRRGPLYG